MTKRGLQPDTGVGAYRIHKGGGLLPQPPPEPGAVACFRTTHLTNEANMTPKLELNEDTYVDVAAQMVAAIEAVHDHEAREQADARSRWRRNVAAAAGAAGKLPQSAVDEVLTDAKTLGIGPEEFAADVHAAIEDTQLSATVEAEQAAVSKAATEVEAVRLEVERLQADYIRERGERDAALGAIESALTAKRRDLERREAEVVRCGSRLSRATDEQMKFRGKLSRQRIFG